MFESSCWLLICMTYMFTCVVFFDETSLGKSSLVINVKLLVGFKNVHQHVNM